MAGKEPSSLPLRHVGNGLVIQDANPLRFRIRCESDPKTREFAAFIGDQGFFATHQAQDFRQNFFSRRPVAGNQAVVGGSDGDNDDFDDEEEDGDDDNDDSHEVEGDDGNEDIIDNTNDVVDSSPEARAVTIAEPDCTLYYSQYVQATAGGSVSAQKDVVAAENGCGFSGRKDASSSSSNSTTESLRAILSDPLTGALMDDALILPCGHSFGAGGVEEVMQMKTCYTCSQPVSVGSITPNLALRVAVQAFRREETMHLNRPSKRRKEASEQKIHSVSHSTDYSRGRNAQFPFSVADRVVIKGNKRTPPRFVGREAIVTTQCLNGWYVVKTLDNAESVKLQYRSLAKAPEDTSLEATRRCQIGYERSWSET